MSNQILDAMRTSVIDDAPETAVQLAQPALETGIQPLDAINHRYDPGMHFGGEQFARRNMFLPDMMASAEAMRAAMAVLEPAKASNLGASTHNQILRFRNLWVGFGLASGCN